MAGRQIRHGTKATLPTLSEGELDLCTDTREVYVGSSVGNIRIHGDYITPEMYGAVGDGVTDDTAAIQAAIDALDAARGGTIWLAPKIYAISSTIELYSNIKYLGHAQMNPTGSELPESGAVLKWIGADGGTMVNALGITGITWDGINLYGIPGESIAGYVPIANGITGIRLSSVNNPISWRNTFTNFEIWYVDTAMDLGHHTVSYESDAFEISNFDFYKVNNGIKCYSYNGTQGAIIRNGRIFPYDRGVYLYQVSLLKICQVYFGSMGDNPANGNCIEIDMLGNQVVIELCQGEPMAGVGSTGAGWNSIKFIRDYSYSAHRPVILSANTFNFPVVVAGAYDIIGIGNLYQCGVGSTPYYTLDFTGNEINYTSIGDVFEADDEFRDQGLGNSFVTIGVQDGDGDINVTGEYQVNGSQIAQKDISGLNDITPYYIPYQGAEEHVVNGSFESGVAGWTPDDCTIASVAGGVKGGNCCEMTPTGATGQIIKQDVTDLVVGETYEFSAFVKSGTSGDEAFELHYFRTSDSLFGDAIAGTSSNTWTKYAINITPNNASFRFHLIKSTATLGTMLFDSVSVRKLTGLEDSPLSTDGTDVDNSGVYKVDGTQVLGAQGVAVADATDATSVILRLNELLARCRAHGIIAT